KNRNFMKNENYVYEGDIYYKGFIISISTYPAIEDILRNYNYPENFIKEIVSDFTDIDYLITISSIIYRYYKFSDYCDYMKLSKIFTISGVKVMKGICYDWISKVMFRQTLLLRETIQRF